MKKLLLSTAAFAALAVSPAFAQEESGVKLDVGGYFKGYGVYVDQDQDNNRNVDMIRDTEVHLSGETTLDNGLTVGAHIEALADQGDSFTIDESYAYFSGSWGRVNFGAEDGAAFLLQVAAPSADSNIDGIRQYVNPFNDTVLNNGGDGVDYAEDLSGKSDKITYLTPVFSGFQAGVSWTPELDRTASRGLNGVATDAANDVYDLAVRYEGKFDAVDVALGGGYSKATSSDADGWNAGVDLGFGPFGLGGAYTRETTTSDDDIKTWVVGTDYTTGPFTLGASYLNQNNDDNNTDTDRYTAGVTYAYGPGMTFRGSVQYQQDDVSDRDGTAVLLGTQVNF